jgi:hypothetical protein
MKLGMELNTDNSRIDNNENSIRFEPQVNGYTGVLTCRRLVKSIVLDHTGMPPEVEERVWLLPGEIVLIFCPVR